LDNEGIDFTFHSVQLFDASQGCHCQAVTIDTGDPDDIHSPDKVQVGKRLAHCALANHEGEKVVSLGPALASVELLPGSIRLHFAHNDGGLVVKGEGLGKFAIAGENRK
jgi:sialate O-acetylesterase